MERLIDAATPLLPADSLAQVRALAQVTPALEKVQGALEEYAKEHGKHWFRPMWLSGGYLQHPSPIALYSNFAGTLDTRIVEPFVEGHTGVYKRIAAGMACIVGSLDWWDSHLGPSAASDTTWAGGDRADSSQFLMLFSSVRRPNPDNTLDELATYEPEPVVTIAHDGYLFAVPLPGLDALRGDTPATARLDRPRLAAALYAILTKQASVVEHARYVGALTAAPRRDYGKMYHKLDKDAVRAVESSVLMVTFEEAEQSSPDDIMKDSLIAPDVGNRWYDKIMTYVVFANGTLGVNGEHTAVDAPTSVLVFDHVLRKMEDGPAFDVGINDTQAVERAAAEAKIACVDFGTFDGLADAVQQARTGAAELYKSVDTALLYYTKHNVRSLAKSAKLSPDTVTQLIIQLAYFRDAPAGKFPTAVYETAATRRFAYGRTETMRPCTAGSIEFCAQFDAEANNRSRQMELLRSAAEQHNTRIKLCSQAQGFDRHMLALRLTAKQMGMPEEEMPGILTTPLLAPVSEFRLSTSQVPGFQRLLGGFAPGATDGYGVCYGLNTFDTRFCLSAYTSSSATDVARFRQVLAQTLDDVCSLFVGGASL